MTYDYDSIQDTLYILFEAVNEPTFYDDVEGRPGVLLRYTVKHERLVGIAVEAITRQLGKAKPSEAEIRRFAYALIHCFNR